MHHETAHMHACGCIVHVGRCLFAPTQTARCYNRAHGDNDNDDDVCRIYTVLQPAARFVKTMMDAAEDTMMDEAEDIGSTIKVLCFPDFKKLPQSELAKLAEYMLQQIRGTSIEHSQDMLHIDYQQKVRPAASFSRRG